MRNSLSKTLVTSHFGIQLSLGCSLDLNQNIFWLISSLDFIGILLFYCLKTVKNNRKTMNNNNCKKNSYRRNTLIQLRSSQSFKYMCLVVHILQLFQVLATCAVFWPWNHHFLSTALLKTVMISKVDMIQPWNLARMCHICGYEK